MEKVSEIIAWSKLLEKLYLTREYEATTAFSSALSSLYACCWSALAKTILYFQQHNFSMSFWGAFVHFIFEKLTQYVERVLRGVFDTEKESSEDIARIEVCRKRVDRTASLIASETLFKQDTLTQKRHQMLVTQLADISIPIERVETVMDESHKILVAWQRDQILDSISKVPYINHHKEGTQYLIFYPYINLLACLYINF